MTMTRVVLFASMIAAFVGRSPVVALAVSPQVSAADAAPPTPKEQALMEHACRATQRPGAAHDAYEECLAARLMSLRADFGTDLSRLSSSARGKIDAACSSATASLGREAYVGCLSGQLASLSASRARAARPADPAATPSPEGSIMPSAALVMTAPQEASLVSVKSGTLVLTAVGAVTALGVVAAVVVFGMKSKRAPQVCRVCSAALPGTGDLCAACRHEAAEPLRRAAGERIERERTEEAEQRQQRDQADQQRQDALRQEEGDRLRQLEDQRRAEDEERRREEDARQEEAEARRQYAAPPPAPAVSATLGSDEGEPEFDPYLGLGLPPDATVDQARAAYEEARKKYDPDLVEHLGFDVKEHFAEKFRTVERAYRMIAGAVDETTNAAAQ